MEINFSTHQDEGSSLAKEGTLAGTEEINDYVEPTGKVELDDLTRQALEDLNDAQLMIDNPVNYEAEIASRFLEDSHEENEPSQAQ